MNSIIKNLIILVATTLTCTIPAAQATPPVDDEQPMATELATFAGGCFWCMEPPFDKLDGVLETTSGYTGGHKEDPSYKEVSAGSTGHLEVVQIRYDPDRVSYLTLLKTFWINIDPTDDGGQFCDSGESYRAAIFFHNEQQRSLAAETLKQLNQGDLLGAPIATRILPGSRFYTAENYHQDYYRKNPVRYKYYRYRCKRDPRLDKLWSTTELPF